jgi:cytochrome c oxidase accessory protein FixG
MNLPLLQPEERVLSTLEKNGRRIWIFPRLSHGRFLSARRAVGYLLIALFTALPYVTIHDKPAVLLDIVHRRFTFLGFTFLPTDTILLALFMVGVLLSIFLITALFGRVWCGWACPQTVYLELVYRPIERLFEGTLGRGGAPTRQVAGWRYALRLLVYLLISMFLAHTFLAYFVGVENLRQWILGSPMNHPTAFLVMAAVTGLMLFDFGYFREQVCIIACPYGRLQSVLLDRDSLIVTYDRNRGEPRGKLRPGAAETRGDCVDCGWCAATCPTGIDIRKGLQMECVGCAQCIDACDTVMDKIGRPRGLIRYSSQNAVEGKRHRLLRPRVLLYPAVLLVIAGVFVTLLTRRASADVTLLRSVGAPFTIVGGDRVASNLRLKIVNRTDQAAAYTVSILDPPEATLSLAPNPIIVPPEGMESHPMIVVVPQSVYAAGLGFKDIRVRVADDRDFTREIPFRLLGPRP